MKPKKQYGVAIRIPAPTLAIVRREAKRSGRTLQSEIDVLIRKATEPHRA